MDPIPDNGTALILRDADSGTVFGSHYLWNKLASMHNRRSSTSSPGGAQADEGIGIIGFLTALVVASIVFTIQVTLFLMLRNKLARILYVAHAAHTRGSPANVLGIVNPRPTSSPSASAPTLPLQACSRSSRPCSNSGTAKSSKSAASTPTSSSDTSGPCSSSLRPLPSSSSPF